MVLIADSGSTKTDWLLTSKNGETVQNLKTKGINPFYQDSDEIYLLLQAELKIPIEKINEVYFYGAGCANEEKNQIVKKAINLYLPESNTIVNSDLLAAAHALCGDQPGIACILGTGSNSCYYDGEKISKNVSPLGYIIGDEGSGAVIGNRLVAYILKNQLPEVIIQAFFQEYNTSRDEILNHIYKQPFANRYLAKFTKFIYKNLQYKELESFILESFDSFIIRNILQYEEVNNLSINFTGSIAFYFKEQLEFVLKNHNLTLGKIYKSPLDGLANYFASLKNNQSLF